MASDLVWQAVSSGLLEVPGSPPDLLVMSPDGNTVVPYGAGLTFETNAVGVEDGLLPEAVISWQSDLDGTIGTGQLLSVETLSLGKHRQTLVNVYNSGPLKGNRHGMIAHRAVRICVLLLAAL
jgi:hypothetical protein